MSAPRVRIGLTQRLRLTQRLTASLKVLAMEAPGLARYLEEQAAENPHLVVARVEPAEWLPRWTGVFRAAGGVAPEAESAALGLMAHVTGEVLRLFPPGRTRDLALRLAESLSAAGWLDRPLPEIAAEAGASVAEIEAVLQRCQEIDPPGLFARTLGECLGLQAREEGWLDPVAQVLFDNLALVAAGEVARLARLAGAPVAEVEARLRRLRRLNPKPGAGFAPDMPALREPDLIARPGPEGWTVELNRSALPALQVRAAPRGAGAAARAQVAEARALVAQVAARGQTLLRIAAEVLRRQEAVLAEGPAAQRPMTMAEVAQALGLHPTTVGRAVAGVSVDTPRGPVWLRRLFSADLGDGVSAVAAQARLAALVAQEDPRRPLSDAALASALAGEGIAAARRTVAKYRAALGLPPAHRRRRA